MPASVLRLGWGTRPRWFAVTAGVVTLVNDGYSGKPAPLVHQLLLIPVTALFVVATVSLLLPSKREESIPAGRENRAGQQQSLRLGSWLVLWGCFEALSLLLMLYERQHFARFGYAAAPRSTAALVSIVLAAGGLAAWKKTPWTLLLVVGLTYAAGLVYAIAAFPLNYLRSDMLPVIIWADRRLLAHLNPYGTMHIGTRLYDFPYLPGMLVAYLPAMIVHLDVRTITLMCNLLIAALLYGSARFERKTEAVVLIGVFLLCPFLQYRHDLYLEPHWLALTASIVLLRYRRWAWSALLFGVSMALYQLSWVLFPFLVLHAYRQRGVREAFKVTGVGLLGMLLIVGPFLRSAMQRIASNTVGQWSHMPHALADPINLSYWVTYLVRPDQLKWVQLTVLTAIFAYCMLGRRCQTLTDTLRWMSAALTIFIMLNVLVDGYFYLTLLLLLLLYTFAASGLWPSSDTEPLADAGHGVGRRDPFIPGQASVEC